MQIKRFKIFSIGIFFCLKTIQLSYNTDISPYGSLILIEIATVVCVCVCVCCINHAILR